MCKIAFLFLLARNILWQILVTNMCSETFQNLTANLFSITLKAPFANSCLQSGPLSQKDSQLHFHNIIYTIIVTYTCAKIVCGKSDAFISAKRLFRDLFHFYLLEVLNKNLANLVKVWVMYQELITLLFHWKWI